MFSIIRAASVTCLAFALISATSSLDLWLIRLDDGLWTGQWLLRPRGPLPHQLRRVIAEFSSDGVYEARCLHHNIGVFIASFSGECIMTRTSFGIHNDMAEFTAATPCSMQPPPL
jgi:hypothetical protein